MKTKSLYIAMAMVAICMSTSSLFAQSNLKLRANVPFNFVAENKTFAAGEYEITQLQPNIIVLRNVDTHFSAIEKTQIGPQVDIGSGPDSLVFQHIQGEYFLKQLTARSNGLNAYVVDVFSGTEAYAG